MILLNNNKQLTSDRLAEIVQRPHHGLLLALQHGEEFSRREPVDNDVANLRQTLRILGQGRRQDTLVFRRIEPAILAKIGFFATCSAEYEDGIDEKTAAIIAPTFLAKPVVAVSQKCSIL